MSEAVQTRWAGVSRTPRTLRMWRDRFDANWPAVSAQDFDETFRRMWVFSLAYCEAGLTTGCIDVVQLQMRRPAEAVVR